MNNSLNTLTIFHLRTGLKIKEFGVPKNVFYISFLSDTDQIIVCSRSNKSKHVLTQLYNCWSGYVLKQDSYLEVDEKDQLLFVGDRFVHVKNNELTLSPLFPPNLESMNVETLIRKSDEYNPSRTLLLDIIIDGNFEHSICWCKILNEERELCRFKFEPWRYYETPNIFLRWLNDKLFLLVGVDSVQIYGVKAKGSLLQVELKYIWVTSTQDITSAFLVISDDHEGSKKNAMENDDVDKNNYLFVHLTNDLTEKIIIPSDDGDDQFSFRVLHDACISLNFLRLQYESNIFHFNRVTISNQIKQLIENSVEKFPAAFTKVYSEDMLHIYPVQDFIMVDWDKILEKILEEDQYIPLFHDDEEAESALSLLIQLQKSELLDLMISYIMKHVHRRSDNPSLRQSGFALTVGKSLLDLYRYCPDIAIKVLKESSYFTISSETNTRTLQTNLGKDERTIDYRQFKPVGINEKLTSFDITEESTHSRDENLSDVVSLATSNLTFYETNQGRQIGKKVDGKTIKKQKLSNLPRTHPAKLCVVPWPDFCVYPVVKDDDDTSFSRRIKRFWERYVFPSQLSPFARIALEGPPEMFDQVSLEAVVKYKWYAMRLWCCAVT